MQVICPDVTARIFSLIKLDASNNNNITFSNATSKNSSVHIGSLLRFSRALRTPNNIYFMRVFVLKNHNVAVRKNVLRTFETCQIYCCY